MAKKITKTTVKTWYEHQDSDDAPSRVVETIVEEDIADEPTITSEPEPLRTESIYGKFVDVDKALREALRLLDNNWKLK